MTDQQDNPSKQVIEIVEKYLNKGYLHWDKMIAELEAIDSGLVRAQNYVTGLGCQCGYMATYLGARGADFTGDHGNEAAVTQVQKSRKRFRRAFGFSYP